MSLKYISTHFPCSIAVSFLLSAGCTTHPVLVKQWESSSAPTSEASATNTTTVRALKGPVFFMPTTEFSVTVPLLALRYKAQPDTVIIAPDIEGKRLITMSAKAVADTTLPLYITDKAGHAVDVSQFQLTLNPDSVLKTFNYTGEDKTGEIAVSLLKVATIGGGMFSAQAVAEVVAQARQSTEPSKVPEETIIIPIEITFPMRARDISVGVTVELEQLIVTETGTSLRDIIRTQNPQLGSATIDLAKDIKLFVTRTVHDAIIAVSGHSTLGSTSVLKQGLDGIPYRLPAKNDFEFTADMKGHGIVTMLRGSSPDNQPLLYAPVVGRRFSKTATGIEIDDNGSLTSYTNTHSSAAAGLISSAQAFADGVKSAKADLAIAKEQRLKDSFTRKIKLRGLIEEKAAKEDEIAAAQAKLTLAKKNSDAVEVASLEGQVRTLQSQLAIIDLNIQAANAGVIID